MAPNGAGLGGWLLNTADNYFETMADCEGDGKAERLGISPSERARVSFVRRAESGSPNSWNQCL